MKIIVGSKTQRKIDITTKVINSFFKSEFLLISYNAQSEMPETPWDKQTFDGAYNRAIDAKKNNHDADIFIGLESGLIERYGHIFEEAWSCIMTKGDENYFGYSSGLKVPDYVLERMKKDNLQHSEVMIQMEREFGLSDSDTWGNYSGNLISRDVSLEEALRNAVIQMQENDKSFYKK